MCFLLYLGAAKKLPAILFSTVQPAFNTRVLEKWEEPVLQHFSMPFVIYIGSHEGCGCSFRHALFDQGSWSDVEWEDNCNVVASQKDHCALVDFLRASGVEEFELYGCWDGDQSMPAAAREEINPDDILDAGFFFRERTHYLVRRRCAGIE